jgi:hypothetical protein
MNPNLRCSEIIEQALNYFGQENVSALCITLEKSGVKIKGEIFNTYEKLALELEKMFGEAASILEQQIIEETSARLNFQPHSEMNFVQAMRLLRNARQQVL